ncbi:MAG: hypothetical protein DMG34_04380 [Acidobacteria bacterium]|nr:MAG: hypothetical protein DMG34_04380 [Acidobacteriota bacterium]
MKHERVAIGVRELRRCIQPISDRQVSESNCIRVADKVIASQVPILLGDLPSEFFPKFDHLK